MPIEQAASLASTMRLSTAPCVLQMTDAVQSAKSANADFIGEALNAKRFAAEGNHFGHER